MDKILARVVELENQGYQFEAAQGSFDLLVKKCVGTYRPHFERVNFRVNVETDHSGNAITEATVKLRVGGQVRHEVAEGDGPVNALDAALRKALDSHFPNLAQMHLVDYKVRVINSEAGTAAGVRVVIESRDEHEVWGTVGVSENIIEASWIALVDSFEYKLCKDESRKSAASKAKPARSKRMGSIRRNVELPLPPFASLQPRPPALQPVATRFDNRIPGRKQLVEDSADPSISPRASPLKFVFAHGSVAAG